MAIKLELSKFKDTKLDDPFFDSLKADYEEFSAWFEKKKDEPVYVAKDDDTGKLSGFVYLKVEDGPVEDVEPVLPAKRRLKIGTLKIVAHGTKLGERVIKKALDKAFAENAAEVYVTVFAAHAGLIALFERYGFGEVGQKAGPNGTEKVLLKDLQVSKNDIILDYPRFKSAGVGKWLLAVYPEYHSNLFPDSLLKTEDASILDDVSFTNTIHKVYVGGVPLTQMARGDLVVIYRTTDIPGRARFRSVATSICVVEEARSKKSFPNAAAFVEFAGPHSIFTSEELTAQFIAKQRLFAVKLTYNVALPKRPIRAQLLDDVSISEQPQWNLRSITDEQFLQIANLGVVNESLIID